MQPPLSTFLALPQLEQRCLTAMVALHRSTTRSDLARSFAAFELRDEKRRQLSWQILRDFLERWRGLGLVNESASGGWIVARDVLHPLAAHGVTNGELQRLAELVRHQEPLLERYRHEARYEYLARELFLALYLLPHADLERALSVHLQGRSANPLLYVHAYGLHVPAAVLRSAGLERAAAYLSSALESSVAYAWRLGEGTLACVEELRGQLPANVTASAAQYLALRGEHALASSLLANLEGPEASAALAFIAMSQADLAAARAHARAAVELTRAKGSKRIKGLQHPLWAWVTLLLVTDQGEASSGVLAEAQLLVSAKKHRNEESKQQALLLIGDHLKGADKPYVESRLLFAEHVETWSDAAIWSAALQVCDRKPGALLKQRSEAWRKGAQEQGFPWLAELVQGGGASLLAEREAPWQRSLRALEHAVQQAGHGREVSTKSERIVWVLQLYEGTPYITPRLQTRKGAGYTGGRAVTLKRLADAGPDSLLDEHDRRVLRHLVEVREPYHWSSPSLRLEPQAALALIGHPRVFASLECDRPLTVERGQPTVQVHAREDGGWTVRAAPPECATQPLVGVALADGRMVIYALSAEQKRVVEQLPAKGLVLPLAAREQAQRTLGMLASLFPMDSALVLDAPQVVEVDADPRIYVQLRRARSGMRLAFCVAPLGTAVRLVPGAGNVEMLGTREGQTLRCTRSLERELEQLDAVRSSCPTLSQLGDEHVLVLSTLIECLEVLCELHALGDRVVVEWPEGDPLRIAAQRDISQLKVRVQDEGAWLSAEGELEVDATLTLSFRALVAREQQRHGRFVALDGGGYLALSDALRRSIEAAEAVSQVDGTRVTLHPLALMALAQLEGAQLEIGGEIAKRLARAREAATLVPALPPTFQATLRPYQREGFTFLRRLAHWDAGACLADDMGLGKTLQTLALLVDRAALGPAVVVAPTSVCANWCDEARKFAPTLRLRRLGAGDRERTLRDLGPFDLLVCSYGVLQQERQRLREVQFQTAVLDEAQAIKNANTQRARAALELKATQRIALTGTPVENHLGELWSILQFVNPGLLGSEREFDQRFARPIQRGDDRARAQLLRRIVAPFLLRRKKSEVLDDLPEKTEITLHVEPSTEERALFAALREEALARVARSAEPAKARMQLLAELMRLRRAACHPALVLPDSSIESSKLAALETLLQELRDNGHRALLFSQFVDHLQLVRARLDTLGLRYQYLDGSSSSAARAASTAAFQAGEGDVFLISLKAGGFGLNLTAADYVVHLDPWWNPAVEDQASDRAHRIGQTRPVTIYRLVMQGSIEEKILALHATKRELADGLLEGSSGGRTFDVDELLSLLNEANTPRASTDLSAGA